MLAGHLTVCSKAAETGPCPLLPLLLHVWSLHGELLTSPAVPSLQSRLSSATQHGSNLDLHGVFDSVSHQIQQFLEPRLQQFLIIVICFFTGKPPPILSLTQLEILLLLNSWYYAMYFVIEILLFIYKSLLLPYTSANLALDLVMLFLYLGVEILRIYFGSKGNLSQRKVPLTISLMLLGPSAVMAVYYMLLQTYVLRLEVTINAILLVFYVFELVLCTVGLIRFSSVRLSD
uniref:transmembrane protein 216 isoform X1 n=2 Tax=Pristiophorus japonicus TaxID=55135 RepID=UPI00398E8496